MLKTLTNFFKGKKEKKTKEYSGFSDFFLHASTDEKKKVMTEAAYKANADQLKVFNEAVFKTKAN